MAKEKTSVHHGKIRTYCGALNLSPNLALEGKAVVGEKKGG